MGGEALQLACYQVLGDDTAGTTVDDDDVFHLITGIEFHSAGIYLAAQCGVGTQQQLLACLTFGIEGT